MSSISMTRKSYTKASSSVTQNALRFQSYLPTRMRACDHAGPPARHARKHTGVLGNSTANTAGLSTLRTIKMRDVIARTMLTVKRLLLCTKSMDEALVSCTLSYKRNFLNFFPSDNIFTISRRCDLRRVTQ